MKKKLIITILIFLILIMFKYYVSDYDITYDVNGYHIITNYENSRFYYEIKKGNFTYNFDYYDKRKLNKSNIYDIEVIKDTNIECIYPKIKNIDTYPLCYENGTFIDYYEVNSEKLSNYKSEDINLEISNKDFVYYKNLNSDEYIALWNYKGYTIMNGKEYEYINIFDTDRYDNSLSLIDDNIIYIADYNETHEYSKIYYLDILTKKYDYFELDTKIDFDSYFVGIIDKYLYLFDNKNSILYEINLKNKEMSIVGDNEIGFQKYDNGSFVDCSKTEYKINKIKYNVKTSIYNYDIKSNGLFKTITNNNKVNQKIANGADEIIAEYNNEIYYFKDSLFYKYTPSLGNQKIFYDYELSFNKNNMIFVYHK